MRLAGYVCAVSYVCVAVCSLAGTNGYSQISSSSLPGPLSSNKTNVTEFRGRLIDGSSRLYEGLVVEVGNLRDRNIRDRADVSTDGSFRFRALPEGDYQVRVLTLYDDEVASTITSVGPDSMLFEIRMPQSRLHKPASGTVSIQQLNHPPSRQVRKLLESGHKLIEEQHYNDAAERFREAAKDDPDCPQAHAELGVALSRMGAWDAAAGEFRAAVSLDPRNSGMHSNLGGALAALNRFDEAEKEALTALKLDPRNPRAHFVMAGILLHKQGTLPQAVAHLVAAQDAIPSAKAAVEKICAANRVDNCP